MRRRLKIASLIPSLHFGGDENRLLIFASHLDKRRFDHSVFVLKPPKAGGDTQRGTIRPMYAEQGVKVREAYVKGATAVDSGGIRGKFRLIHHLAKILRDEQIDIVDARLNYGIAIGAAAARLAGVPVVVGTAYHHHTLRGPVKYPLGQASVLALDALISDSQFTIDGYQRWLLRRHPKAVVIQNGIPVPIPSRNRSELLQVFQLPESPEIRVIGQISRQMPFKGQDILIRAAAGALRRSQDLYLLLCGFAADPQYRQRLFDLAREEGVGDKVRIAGYQGPIGDVWSLVDVHAHPTLLDSSPIAIHESMALGLPALVSDEAGIPELVADGVSGIIVPKGDVRACEAGLLRLLDDPELRSSLGAGARARYLNYHTPEAMTRTTETLFEELVRSKGVHTSRRDVAT
jgi:glycosyltransferase involved in cell wall biosynthesis